MEIDSHTFCLCAEKFFIKSLSPLRLEKHLYVLSNHNFQLFMLILHFCLSFVAAIVFYVSLSRLGCGEEDEKDHRYVRQSRARPPFELRYRSFMSRISDECFPPIFGVKLNSRLLWDDRSFRLCQNQAVTVRKFVLNCRPHAERVLKATHRL